ncbi:MAG: double-strand break repair helicase AddA [Alphaproteobacteria bacterium]|nr:double-strand break repair helicase AddA [Alphaproteobacteria bacterium]
MSKNVDPGYAGQMSAADPKASVWVAANAGAGKTRVLVNRVTRLLLGGTAPGRILCLTFTKAAAAEMSKRLFEQLGAWTTQTDSKLAKELFTLLGRKAEPEEMQEARRLFAATLDAPGGLKIQTIHSFCESLLARFPLEAGVSPHCTVMDERSAAETLDQAYTHVLTQAHDGSHPALEPALNLMVSLVDETVMAKVLKEVATHRHRLKRLFAETGGPRDMGAGLRTLLGLGEKDSRESVIKAACRDTAFDGKGLKRACAALETGSKKDVERAQRIANWLEQKKTRDALLVDYARAFLTQKNEPQKTLLTKAVEAADAGARDILETEQARILALMNRLKALAVAKATTALLTFSQALIDRYEAEKETRALLDYEDLIHKARDLLRHEEGINWVLYKLDGGIDHILVDEAQDTSPAQWEVIEALSGEFFAGEGRHEDSHDTGRTIFAVGDEKQSIYSFQGAEPEAFEKMRNSFAGRVTAAGADWRPVELSFCYRTAPKLLAAIDKVFARAEANAGLTAGGGETRHHAYRKGQAGCVELWPTVKPGEKEDREPWDTPLDRVSQASPEAVLATRIAARISGWIENGEILESQGRPIRPGDILVLVRRRTAFVDELVRCLKNHKVPVAGTDRMVLTEQMAVMDLMALGAFLLLPEDDLNLAVVLKGPLFGFDDDDLFALAHKRKGKLWSELQARRDESPRFTAACDQLRALLKRADFTSPFAFYAELLGPDGGRKRLTARLGRDANDPMDEFLNLALEFERAHTPSLQGFLHWLAAGSAEIKRDLEQDRDEVRVMTVHGAKGLEANIVFLPDTCGAPSAHHDAALLWTGSGGGDESRHMLWPVRRDDEDEICGNLRDRARARRADEHRRLLYVAMTRARDRLYVCGWETSKERSSECWYNLVGDALEATAEPVELEFGETGWRLSTPQAAEPDGERKEEADAQTPPALPGWAREMSPGDPLPPVPLAPSRPEIPEPSVLSPLETGGDKAEGMPAFARGRLIHRLLQSLPDLAPSAREEAAQRYLALAAPALDEKEKCALAQAALAVLHEPGFAPLFAPGSLAEAPLCGVVNGRVISGQVDRMAVGENEVLVVDYKSNRAPPGKGEAVPEVYLRQMAAYGALCREIYPDKKIRCALLWTDGPAITPLEEAELDRHAP